jgi:hypothetical protein
LFRFNQAKARRKCTRRALVFNIHFQPKVKSTLRASGGETSKNDWRANQRSARRRCSGGLVGLTEDFEDNQKTQNRA